MTHPSIQALNEGRFFKVICGASYRNADFVATLAQIFTAGGAHCIDVGAKPEMVEAALRGIAQTGIAPERAPLVMVSIGINQDVHFLRVEKDFDRCDSNGYCANACPHEVFVGSEIRLENCLGCDHCVIACPTKALSLVARDPLAEVRSRLKACLDAGARALEVHTGTGARTELQEVVALIAPYRDRIPLLAFSMGSHGQSPEEIAALARDVVALAGPDIILQADGKPISGRKGEKSTLPCLELAERLLAEKLPAWVQVSGGTNDLTGRLAQTRGVAIHGVGMGTFARKFINVAPSDELTPETLSQCIDRARTLVHSVTPNLAALK